MTVFDFFGKTSREDMGGVQLQKRLEAQRAAAAKRMDNWDDPSQAPDGLTGDIKITEEAVIFEEVERGGNDR